MPWRKFSVTLIFGGDDCPQLPSKSFIVQAQGFQGAFNIACYDALHAGYKRAWIVGHHVEVL